MIAERARMPDLLLEQYELGELSAEEKAYVESALETDLSLRDRLAEIRASNRAILREAPPAEIAAAIRRRMLTMKDDPEPNRGPAPQSGASRARPFKPLSTLVLPAAAALLVLAGALAGRSVFFPTVAELSRPKGGAPGISVYKKAASGPEELRDGSAASAGDVLQIKYAAGSQRFGVIFSLDGKGTLTRHLPLEDSAARAPRLAEAGALLDSAYELDDAPGFERFFLLSSTNDFDVAVAADALRDLIPLGPEAATAAPRLPSGIEWKSLLLRKTGGPR